MLIGHKLSTFSTIPVKMHVVCHSKTRIIDSRLCPRTYEERRFTRKAGECRFNVISRMLHPLIRITSDSTAAGGESVETSR
jgi:hypothetical protein